jgi:hypothetical protein
MCQEANPLVLLMMSLFVLQQKTTFAKNKGRHSINTISYCGTFGELLMLMNARPKGTQYLITGQISILPI